MNNSQKNIPSITDFELKVYKITARIPKGKTMTYGEVAKALNSSPRAVGQALKRNPYAPEVPCHRVIHSDGRIGGYNGIKDSRKKVKMLRQEGINISDNKKI